MQNKILSVILLFVLAFTSACSSATPTSILNVEPPTATANLGSTQTPEQLAPTSAATTRPQVQAPVATLAVTPTEKPVTIKEPDWTFATGAPIWGPITVSSGVIYFGSDDGFVYAVDAQSHALKWKYQTGGAVRSRAAVADNLVYAASDNGNLYALFTKDGSLAWKTQTGDPPSSPRFPMFSWNNYQLGGSGFDVFTSGPTVSGNIVYAGGTDDNLYALSASTGRVIWKFHAVTSTLGIRQTPVIGNDMVYFGDLFGNFYAIDIKTGSQVWNYPVPYGDAIYSNQATLVDQTIYVPFVSSIVALDALTGNLKWKTPSFVPNGYALKTPAYADGILYADGYQNNTYYPLAAYEAVSGNLLWMTNLTNPEGLAIGSPAIGKTNVYTGTFGGGLYAVDKTNGAAQWMVLVQVGKDNVGVNSSPVVADGMVYFGGMDGNLYAVQDE